MLFYGINAHGAVGIDKGTMLRKPSFIQFKLAVLLSGNEHIFHAVLHEEMDALFGMLIHRRDCGCLCAVIEAMGRKEIIRAADHVFAGKNGGEVIMLPACEDDGVLRRFAAQEFCRFDLIFC